MPIQEEPSSSDNQARRVLGATKEVVEGTQHLYEDKGLSVISGLMKTPDGTTSQPYLMIVRAEQVEACVQADQCEREEKSVQACNYLEVPLFGYQTNHPHQSLT